MKHIIFSTLLFTLTLCSCQKPVSDAELIQIAQSEEVGKYLIASNRWLLDSRIIFKKDSAVKKEYYNLFRMNPFKKACDWDVSNSSPEIVYLTNLKCEEYTTANAMKEKYPVYTDKTAREKILQAAYSQNRYYLEADVSNPDKYLHSIKK